jgi:hypothetical protein
MEVPAVRLMFPEGYAVGMLSGDSMGEPVLATGVVEVPEGVELDLEVHGLHGTDRNFGQKRRIETGDEPTDLGFIDDLPPDSISGLTLRSPVKPGSLSHLPHLGPGLRRLVLAGTELPDPAIAYIAELRGLRMLQSFGNRFIDEGVQPLAALQCLEVLYLEESTLTVRAFDFTARLPSLQRIGLRDADLSSREKELVREMLQGVVVVP